MPCEMHVGTEHHSITVCFKIEQMGTLETVLRFDVQKNILQGQNVCYTFKFLCFLGNHL